MELLLTRSWSITSFLIRLRLTLSKKRIEPWSHAILVLDDGVNCIDSTFKLNGVRPRPLAEALHGIHPRQMKRHPLALPKADEALAVAKSLIGRPYDTRNVFGWGIGSREWDDAGGEYCFEFLARVIEAGSNYRFPSLQRVSGRDLEQAALHLVSTAQSA